MDGLARLDYLYTGKIHADATTRGKFTLGARVAVHF